MGLVAFLWAAATMVVAAHAQGYWETVVGNAGIATMHSAVTHYGNVVLLDRTNVGPSQLNLAKGVCRDNPQDRVRSFQTPVRKSSIETRIHVISKVAGYGDEDFAMCRFDF